MKITQSSIKDYYNEATCKFRWLYSWVFEINPKQEGNAAMYKGSYFEYLCIGGGSGNSENVTDLPRKKNGEKTADQIRIEEQASAFKKLFDPENKNFIGYNIISTQEKISFDDEEGTLDIVCENPTNKRKIILDLKLTADVGSEYSYWNSDTSIDLTQPTKYTRLFKRKYNEDCDFYYLVFDYSPRKNISIIKIHLKDGSFNELNKKEENIINFINSHKDIVDDESYYNPSISECEKCKAICHLRKNQ